MFVRVSVGVHEATGTATYRVCQIVGHQDGTKRYIVGNTKTVRRLMLRFGVSEKLFYIDMVSNQSPQEEEFNRWAKEMNGHGEQMPSLEQAKEWAEAYRHQKSQAWTDEMILERQKRLHEAGQAAATAAAKLKIQARLDIANEAGDNTESQKLQTELRKIERTMEQKKEAARNAYRKGLTELNMRNKAKKLAGLQLAKGWERSKDARMATQEANYWSISSGKAKKDEVCCVLLLLLCWCCCCWR